MWQGDTLHNTFKISKSTLHSMIMVRSTDSSAIGVFVGKMSDFWQDLWRRAA